MLRRENTIGILLLIFCAVVAAILIRAIVTGVTPEVPSSFRAPFTVLGVVLMIVLIWRQFSGRFRK